MGETFWDHLNSPGREVVESESASRSLADGDYLFRQADRSNSVYVVTSGRLKLIRSAATGREILLEIRGPGSLVGELGAIDDSLRSASARSVGRVEVLTVESARFNRMLAEHASVSHAVLRSLATRMRQTVDRRVQAGVGDVKNQLCGRLLELVDVPVNGTSGPIEVQSPLTQQEFADWLGVSRDAIVIALQQLRSDGVVETGRRKIRLLDVAKLQRMASKLD